VITLVASVPGEVDTRTPAKLLVAIHPALDRDEAEAPRPIPAELDERLADEVESVTLLQLHLHDPPPANHAHRSIRQGQSTTVVQSIESLR
jgi:hypothetical protein